MRTRRILGILLALNLFPGLLVLLACLQGAPPGAAYLAGWIINGIVGGLGAIILLILWLLGALD